MSHESRKEDLLGKMKGQLDNAVKQINSNFTNLFLGLGTKVAGHIDDIAALYRAIDRIEKRMDIAPTPRGMPGGRDRSEGELSPAELQRNESYYLSRRSLRL